MSATVEEYIELLNAEQHVDLQKLRDYARHGVQPEVRGEVWLYLLGVLSDDKSQEMTAVRNKYLEYDSLDKHNTVLEKRIRSECSRYYQCRLASKARPGRALTRSTYRGAILQSTSVSASSASLSSSALADLARPSEGSLSRLTLADRGPNRVNDGHLLALTGRGAGAGWASHSETEDPEAAAAQELKRFTGCVENVICAYLNRYSWKAESAAHELGEDVIDEGEGALGRTGSGPSVAPSGFESVSPNPTPPSSISSVQRDLDLQQFDLLDEARLAREREVNRQVQRRPLPGNQRDFHPALVYLCAPFVRCVRVEAGMYFAFEKLMSMIDAYHAANPLSNWVATFMTLLRTTLPELHAYFEEEEVDIVGFATSWLQHLLAGEMRIEDLMRLWDTYFAVPDPLDLHLYVCIAILTNCKDALEELDQSETKTMLFSLPPLDVDRIINEAINIRLSHRQSQAAEADD